MKRKTEIRMLIAVPLLVALLLHAWAPAAEASQDGTGDGHGAYENARRNYEETYRDILSRAAGEAERYSGMETGERVYTALRGAYMDFKQRYAVSVTAGLVMTGAAGFVLSRKNRLWQRTFLMIGILVPVVMWILIAAVGISLG